jgi:hypothetical protein
VRAYACVRVCVSVYARVCACPCSRARMHGPPPIVLRCLSSSGPPAAHCFYSWRGAGAAQRCRREREEGVRPDSGTTSARPPACLAYTLYHLPIPPIASWRLNRPLSASSNRRRQLCRLAAAAHRATPSQVLQGIKRMHVGVDDEDEGFYTSDDDDSHTRL